MSFLIAAAALLAALFAGALIAPRSFHNLRAGNDLSVLQTKDWG